MESPNNLNEPLLEDEYQTLQGIFSATFNSSFTSSQQNKIFRSNFPNNNSLLTNLNVRERKGLDMKDLNDIKKREKSFNSFKEFQFDHKPFFSFLKSAISDPMLQGLIEGSIVGLIVGIIKDGIKTGWYDSAAILISVFIVAPITAVFNYENHKKFESLMKEMSKKKVIVRRNSTLTPIEERELLTGDILKIQQGDTLNVHGVLLSGHLLCYNSHTKKVEDMTPNGQNFLIVPPLKVEQGEGEMVVIIINKKQILEEKEKEYISSLKMHSNIDIDLENKKNAEVNEIKTQDNNEKEDKIDILNDSKEENNIHNKNMHKDLNNEIATLSESIGRIGVIMGVALGVVMFVKTVIYNYMAHIPIVSLELIVVLVDAYIISEAMKVVAIPEGLPMAGNISIAYSINKMIDDNVLINHLNKISAISKMNYLIINKSSVCRGEPRVKEAYIKGSLFDSFKNNISHYIINDIIYNTSSKLIKFENQYIPTGESIDNLLLNFLLENCDDKFDKDALADGEKENEMKQKIKFNLPFNPSYNYMMTIVENENEIDQKTNKKPKYICYIKGFSDIVIHMCSSYYTEKDKYENINVNVTRILKNFAAKNYGILILCKKYIDELEIDEGFYKDFIITGIMGLSDDLQENINYSIDKIKNCGVNLKMLTNENIDASIKTCEIINLLSAKQANKSRESLRASEELEKGKFIFKYIMETFITQEYQYAIHGNKLVDIIGGVNKMPLIRNASDKKESANIPNQINKNEDSSTTSLTPAFYYTLKNSLKFARIVPNIKLIVDITSEQKQILIHGIKEIGEGKNVVGVTVTNQYEMDDISNRLADVTFSSHFSKGINVLNDNEEDSDVLTLSNSISTILCAILHSRNIYDSIRKFIQYQLTVCLVTVTFETIGNLFYVDAPLTTVQMLWINLIMDSLGAIALATDEPDEDSILKYRPYSGKLFNKTMYVNILVQFIYQILVLMFFLLYGHKILGVPYDRTLRHHQWDSVNGYQLSFIFNTFVFMQVFNMINCRKVHSKEYNVFKGMLKNKYFMAVFVFVATVQLLFINFGGRIMRTHDLSLKIQLITYSLSAFGLVIGFVAKLFIDDDETLTPEELNDEVDKIELKKLMNSKSKHSTRNMRSRRKVEVNIE